MGEPAATGPIGESGTHHARRIRHQNRRSYREPAGGSPRLAAFEALKPGWRSVGPAFTLTRRSLWRADERGAHRCKQWAAEPHVLASGLRNGAGTAGLLGDAAYS